MRTAHESVDKSCVKVIYRLNFFFVVIVICVSTHASFYQTILLWQPKFQQLSHITRITVHIQSIWLEQESLPKLSLSHVSHDNKLDFTAELSVRRWDGEITHDWVEARRFFSHSLPCSADLSTLTALITNTLPQHNGHKIIWRTYNAGMFLGVFLFIWWLVSPVVNFTAHIKIVLNKRLVLRKDSTVSKCSIYANPEKVVFLFTANLWGHAQSHVSWKCFNGKMIHPSNKTLVVFWVSKKIWKQDKALWAKKRIYNNDV